MHVFHKRKKNQRSSSLRYRNGAHEKSTKKQHIDKTHLKILHERTETNFMWRGMVKHIT